MSSTPVAFAEFAALLLAKHPDATDLHVESGSPVMLRRAARDWVVAELDDGKHMAPTLDDLLAFVGGIYTGEMKPPSANGKKPEWYTKLVKNGSLHPATTLTTMVDGVSSSIRIRCTIQRQGMGDALGLVMRPLRDPPASLLSLGLPVHATMLLQQGTSGLIVVTGPTGSGKSTTLAAMVNEVNVERSANILTIEDPIEFLHDRKKSIINQREVGNDVLSFEAGVRDALRFVPDVILVGEIRDAETMRAAVRAGESGHLVLTSLHAPTCFSAIRKMVSYLGDSPADVQALSGSLVGVIAQALIPFNEATRKSGRKGNALAYEILNARHESISGPLMKAIGDGNSAGLVDLEEKVHASVYGQASVPMMRSIREHLSKGVIDAQRAATVVSHQKDLAELMGLMPRTNTPATPSRAGR